MKKIIYAVAAIATLVGCKSTQQSTNSDLVVANLDLVNVDDDKVMVSVDPGKFTTEETTFYIPKTVPGTYSTDNYGQFIEGVKAIDYKGNELSVTKLDDNSWKISNATALDKVTYWVNDSYDIEGEEGVFSPAGTNIKAGENFMLNLHGFVGYFDGMSEKPYQLVIKHPKDLIAGTSLKKVAVATDEEQTYATDQFNVSRYFEVTDHPIMYSTPDTTSFQLQGMKVKLQVYSPNKAYSVEDIAPKMKEMMQAQKAFLGEIDNTDVYAVLLYLSDVNGQDAQGFGALEHHTSTTVVLPESMPLERLNETMKDVVSHEFFHIITPLSVHSNEVHYFDYNDPEMSQHLWMYEGVTEYFANLFQVKEGLIDHQAFYDRMSEKITSSKQFDDTMPFTVMSENILDEEYESSYYNVYQKGALIGMSLDIRLRELSNGEMGILDLMKKLSNKYGKDKPFEDEELIPAIVELTYPEIQSFFDTYITGTTPIPYGDFFAKVGVEEMESEVQTGVFLKGQQPYIDGNPQTKELFFREGIAFNSFLNELGVEPKDVIKSVNGTEYNIENVYGLIMGSRGWKEGDQVTMVIERDGEEKTLEAAYKTPTDKETKLQEMELSSDDQRVKLRKAWLEN
ncbi:M61 family metallopeptidase [Mesonia mobilis]|uniref:Peptidase M61 n=1 Tax=Mesonia mobilis TaxID=369791 RepID=A0ABQ3BZ62_9FLAO|nr:peptidase M61 [Mesonia mobilis]MBQ0737180.1 peptidase M61 [Aquimarina celericrescens]GGZ62390.1 peptidase M61 [Mesonia mobilis]